ncbi:MAG: hypothetical protein ACRC3I_06885 [Cetobacterium sp.]
MTMDFKKYLNRKEYTGQLLVVNKHNEKLDSEFKEKESLSLKDLENAGDIIEIDSGKRLTYSININLDWIFIPFNLDSEDTRQEEELLKMISNLLGIEVENLNVEALAEKAQQLEEKDQILFFKNLKAIYDSILPKSKVKGKKLQSLKKAYRSVIDDIGVIQIPHHGSIGNYQRDLIFKNVKECFINCPTVNNRGWHPNKKVVDDIIQQKRKSYTLTEENSTLKYGIYYFKNEMSLKYFGGIESGKYSLKKALIGVSKK